LHVVGLHVVIILQTRHKKTNKWPLYVGDPTLTVLAPESYFLYPPDFRAIFPYPRRNGKKKKKQRIGVPVSTVLAQLSTAQLQF